MKGRAKKTSRTSPSTNIPVTCLLCTVDVVSKLQPAFWKYNIYAHLRSQHSQYWDFDRGLSCGLPKTLMDNIFLSVDELQCLHITVPSDIGRYSDDFVILPPPMTFAELEASAYYYNTIY
jgi:hypothetical protein